MDAAMKGYSRARILKSILMGGLIAGILDGLDAVVFFGLTVGVTPARIFKHIASGLLGSRAFRGGWMMVVVGVGLHFLIATGAATVFFIASRKLGFLIRRPFVWGPLFGVAVFAFMYRVVVPLSLITQRTKPMSLLEFGDELLAHMAVGLSIALVANHFSTGQDVHDCSPMVDWKRKFS